MSAESDPNLLRRDHSRRNRARANLGFEAGLRTDGYARRMKKTIITISKMMIRIPAVAGSGDGKHGGSLVSDGLFDKGSTSERALGYAGCARRLGVRDRATSLGASRSLGLEA